MSEIDITKLREHLPFLAARWQEKDDAALTYNAAIDAVSGETGVEKPVLKRLVNAIKKEKAEAEKAAADELSELLDALA